MKHRRAARELALQVLYSCEMSAQSSVDELAAYLAQKQHYSAAAVSYGRELVATTLANKARIDEVLQAHAANWDIKRMAAIDRNILRMAIAELLFYPDVPFKVVIDEAVEIAKLYGSDDSGKFVNGVLDAVYKARFASSR